MSRCTVKPLKGDIPTLNSLFTRVVDARDDKKAYMYIYGGTREIDHLHMQLTNDFYRLNLETLEWENLAASATSNETDNELGTH